MSEVANWINVAGFSGHGVQQAAVRGRLVAEEVLGGKTYAIDIGALRLDRFTSGESTLAILVNAI